MTEQTKHWMRRILAKDCLILLLIFLTALLPMLFIHVTSKLKHAEFQQEIASIEIKVLEIEKNIIEMRQLLPMASADRWSKSMMRAYDAQLFAHLQDNTKPRPDIETIKLTTPIMPANRSNRADP